LSENTLGTPTTEDDSLKGLEDAYSQWRERAYSWLAAHSRGEIADLLFLAPDLAVLLFRLVQDSRVPIAFKAQLLLVLAYVVSPADLIPEAIFGAAGLSDDVVLMSVMLVRLLQSVAQIDSRVLQSLWPGKGDIAEVVQQVAENPENLVNTKVWRGLKSLFGLHNPDPPLVNQDKS
jgi:uncharacterized membrane protein YkvA (DUF1232 family)